MAEKPERVALIACEIFFREICHGLARSPEVFDLFFLPKGLHDLGGNRMRQILQAEIDRLDEKNYRRIILGYALCNNGTVGLSSRRHQLVIPKAHDCITLFFGSRQKYQEYFFQKPGTYFHTSGWLERGEPESQYFDAQLGPSQGLSEFITRYGEENGRYLWEMLNPEKNYHRIAYISLPLPELPDYRDQSRQIALQKGWEWEEVFGTPGLLHRLLNGPYSEKEFLVLAPNRKVVATNDDEVIAAG